MKVLTKEKIKSMLLEAHDHYCNTPSIIVKNLANMVMVLARHILEHEYDEK